MSLDLHLHSTVSDGRLRPAELVRLAAESGVKTMALTDHDSTDGVEEAEAVGLALGVRIIPGIELSTDVPGASIHMLGLFLDHQTRAFQQTIDEFREARIGRVHEMVARLEKLGAPISAERVFALAGEGSVGRPHVAQALLEAGHIRSIPEAFDRFLRRDGPAYVEGARLEPADAIRLIHSVGGFASWAHPLELDGRPWQEYLPGLVEAGLDGIEVYYGKSYTPGEEAELLRACEANGLVPTVGSDFHGFEGLTRVPGSVPSPANLLERLEAHVENLRAGA